MLRRFLAAFWLLGCALTILPVQADVMEEPVYELRIYTCEMGKLPALLERFRDHTLRMFEKHGIKNLAYWTPSEGEAADNTLIYLLEHPSREASTAAWAAFRADPEWQLVAKNSEIQHGKILARPPESIFLTRTDYSPEVGLPPAGKVFELRTYTAAPGKFKALNNRFRDHTDQLFQKHGMTAYGYWIPMDSPKSEDTLIYVLESDSLEAAQASWAAFREDPEWQKVFAESQKDGSLTAHRPASVFMELTELSPVAPE